MSHTQSKSSPGNTLKLILGLLLLFAASLMVVACGDFKLNETLPTAGASKITVVVTDPATCQSPSGPYSHVYLTIADVRANMNESAGDSDSGWVDLTPGLSGAPMQVDLLGKADYQCFLATLGDNTGVPPGNYKQFRVILASNSAAVTANACGTSANCIVMASDSSVHPIELGSEATNGITITTTGVANHIVGAQIGDGFIITANQLKTLDIDILACESIIQDEQGSYHLKPMVTAGEVGFFTNAIRGKVLDGATGQPVKGTVLVALERQDGGGVDRVLRATLAEADGSFTFCPPPLGAFDIVIVGTGSDGTFYEPSVLVYVLKATNIGTVKLYPVTPADKSFVTLTGALESWTDSQTGTTVDTTVSVLENAANGQTFTIPLPPTSTQSSATLSVATAAPNGTLNCASGTYCADYSVQVPAGAANFVEYQKQGTRLSSNGMLAVYQTEGLGWIPYSGGARECNYGFPFRTPPTPSVAGETVSLWTLLFEHCQ